MYLILLLCIIYIKEIGILEEYDLAGAKAKTIKVIILNLI